MKILVCPDSFKGSLSSSEAAAIIKKAFCDTLGDVEAALCPLADGGEGTVDAFCCALGGKKVSTCVHDPLMRPIDAEFALCSKTAVIETAAASGITLLKQNELSPLNTTTYGTGELILEALDCDINTLIIGLGGSATNDGGMGLLSALGIRFFNKYDREQLQGGGSLKGITRIDLSGLDKRLKNIKIIAACDVESPLCGENGASKVFARQKGADDMDIEFLEGCLLNYAEVSKNTLGADYSVEPGAGAAGGVGFALRAYLNAELVPCFSLLCDALSLDEKVRESDVVITGEGKTDASSLLGKLPLRISETAKRHGKKCILISGDIDCPEEKLGEMFDYAFKARLEGDTVEAAMKNAASRLYAAACRAARLFKEQ